MYSSFFTICNIMLHSTIADNSGTQGKKKGRMAIVEEVQASKSQKERLDPTSVARINEKMKAISEITIDTSFFVLNVSQSLFSNCNHLVFWFLMQSFSLIAAWKCWEIACWKRRHSISSECHHREVASGKTKDHGEEEESSYQSNKQRIKSRTCINSRQFHQELNTVHVVTWDLFVNLGGFFVLGWFYCWFLFVAGIREVRIKTL